MTGPLYVQSGQLARCNRHVSFGVAQDNVERYSQADLTKQRGVWCSSQLAACEMRHKKTRSRIPKLGFDSTLLFLKSY
jgi:hypothetical protein